MTNIKSGDGDNNPKNPGDGDDFIAGAGGTNKPAEGEKTAATADADKTTDNTIAGAGSADKNKRNLKSNLGKIFGWAVKGIVFGPPLPP